MPSDIFLRIVCLSRLEAIHIYIYITHISRESEREKEREKERESGAETKQERERETERERERERERDREKHGEIHRDQGGLPVLRGKATQQQLQAQTSC